jgi:hypothetical protein
MHDIRLVDEQGKTIVFSDTARLLVQSTRDIEQYTIETA